LTVGIQKDVNIGEYKKYIKHLSKRELDVIEAVLAGNYSHKELSKTLNISVNTVKTHLKNIYQTTGVSNITALSSLFYGFTPNHP
jgi:DNA-binding CsgD family transcriptional regulator